MVSAAAIGSALMSAWTKVCSGSSTTRARSGIARSCSRRASNCGVADDLAALLGHDRERPAGIGQRHDVERVLALRLALPVRVERADAAVHRPAAILGRDEHGRAVAGHQPAQDRQLEGRAAQRPARDAQAQLQGGEALAGVAGRDQQAGRLARQNMADEPFLWRCLARIGVGSVPVGQREGER